MYLMTKILLYLAIYYILMHIIQSTILMIKIVIKINDIIFLSLNLQLFGNL